MFNGIPAEGKSAQRRRVLLVEDNHVYATVYKGLLDREGYDVTHVAEGDTALSALQFGRYDVVLLDFLLPEMDGVEILRRTRMRDQSFNTPVIVLTEADMNMVQEEMGPYGVSQFFTKTGTRSREILQKMRDLIPDAPTGGSKQQPPFQSARTETGPLKLKMAEAPAMNVRKTSQVVPDPLETSGATKSRKRRNDAAADMGGFFRRIFSLW